MKLVILLGLYLLVHSVLGSADNFTQNNYSSFCYGTGPCTLIPQSPAPSSGGGGGGGGRTLVLANISNITSAQCIVDTDCQKGYFCEDYTCMLAPLIHEPIVENTLAVSVILFNRTKSIAGIINVVANNKTKEIISTIDIKESDVVLISQSKNYTINSQLTIPFEIEMNKSGTYQVMTTIQHDGKEYVVSKSAAIEHDVVKERLELPRLDNLCTRGWCEFIVVLIFSCIIVTYLLLRSTSKKELDEELIQ